MLLPLALCSRRGAAAAACAPFPPSLPAFGVSLNAAAFEAIFTPSRFHMAHLGGPQELDGGLPERGRFAVSPARNTFINRIILYVYIITDG